MAEYRYDSKYSVFSDLDLFHMRRLPREDLVDRLGAPTWKSVKSLYSYRGVYLGKSRAEVIRPSRKERLGVGVLIKPARLGSTGCESGELDEVFREKEVCPFREECRRQFEEFGVMACEEIDEEEMAGLGTGGMGV